MFAMTAASRSSSVPQAWLGAMSISVLLAMGDFTPARYNLAKTTAKFSPSTRCTFDQNAPLWEVKRMMRDCHLSNGRWLGKFMQLLSGYWLKSALMPKGKGALGIQRNLK